MEFTIEKTKLNDVLVIVPQVFQDDRGFFSETFREDKFLQLGLPHVFVQDNHSRSARGVLRGLHFQWNPPMGKLMRVTSGAAFIVAVDIRKGSPSLGDWFGIELSAENKQQVWAPAGFARGFCVLSEYAELQYKCTGHYNGDSESSIRWNDPGLAIDWPIQDPQLSDKDCNARTLLEWLNLPESDNFRY